MLYKAFISYSHSADTSLASAIRTGLQTFSKPWYRRRALEIFLDEASLGPGHELWPTIKNRMAESEYLVLLASPKAAASEAVRSEIEFWLNNRSIEKLVIVQTGGDMTWDGATGDFDWVNTTSLPDILRGRFSDEPLWLDLRWASGEQTLPLSNHRFRDAIATLSSPLRNRRKDELIGEDIEQHRTTIRLAWSAVGIFALLAVSAGIAAFFAVQQRDLAEQQKRFAERQTQTAQARLLAIESEQTLLQSPRLLPRSMLLAIESLKLDSTAEAQQVLRRSLQLIPRPVKTYSSRNAFEDPLSFSFAPDGKTLAAGTHGGEILLWDTTKDTDPVVFDTELSMIQHATVYRSLGSELLVVGLKGIQRMDLETRQVHDRLIDKSNRWRWITSRNGNHTAAIVGQGRISVYDVGSGNVAAIISCQGNHAESTRLKAIALSHDGRYLAGRTTDTVRIWDTWTGNKIITLTPDKGDENTVFGNFLFSPNSYQLALVRRSTETNTVTLYDIPTTRIKTQLQLPASTADMVLEFDQSGRYLATVLDDVARVWEVSTEKQLIELPSSAVVYRPQGIAFSKDATQFASIAGPVVHVWSVADNRERYRIVHDKPPSIVTFSPDGKTLATGGNGILQIWDIVNSAGIQRIALPNKANAIATEPDSRYMAVASDAGLAYLWDLDPDHEIAQFRHSAGSSHTSMTERIAFSADEPRFVTTGRDNSTAIWSLADGTEINRFQHDTSPGAIQLGPHGRYLAGLLSSSKETVVWDTVKGKKLGTLQHEYSGWRPLFSPDGRFLSVRMERSVSIWQLPELTHLSTVEQPDKINDMSFSFDGTRMATAGEDGMLRVWRVDTGTELRRMQHPHKVTRLAWSNDGKTLFTSSGDRVLRRWDADNASLLSSLDSDADIKKLSISKDARHTATVDDRQTARVWDSSNKQIIFKKQYDYVQLVAFSPDNTAFAVLTRQELYVHHADTGDLVFHIKRPIQISAFAYGPAGTYIAIGLTDGSAELLETASGKTIHSVRHHTEVANLYDIAISQNGKKLATSAAGSAYVWDIESGTELLRVGIMLSLSRVALSSNGTLLATGGDSSSDVWVWDIATGEKIFNASNGGIATELAFSMDGKYIAAGNASKSQADIWQIENRQPVFQAVHARKRGSGVFAIAFSPDHQYLATGSRDGTVRLWSIPDGQESMRFEHGALVFALAFSPDSTAIATAGFDHTVRIWNLETGEQMALFTHPEIVRSVSFSHNGQRLVTRDDKGTVRVWMLGQEELLADACARMTRNLTWGEWVQYIGRDKPYEKTCEQLPIHLSVSQEIRNLARSGNIDRARAGFQRMRTLEPDADIDPDKELGYVGNTVYAEGRKLAEVGRIDAAVSKFRLAKLLNPASTYDPVYEAHEAAQMAQIEQAEKLLKEGKYADALAALSNADTFETGRHVSSKLWNELCWGGSTHRRADTVLDACEKAVSNAADEDKPYYRDSRGVARVLTNNYKGAIEDFNAFLNWVAASKPSEWREDSIRSRESWVKKLENGENPFQDIDIRTIE